MIFCSVGTQLPFERLVDYLFKWSNDFNVESKNIVIQAGKSVNKKSGSNILVRDFIGESDFSSYFKEAEVIISHAGMGNIISSIELNKPIVIVPRLSTLNEHRNDHQVDSAKRFSNLSSVFVANNYNEFCESLTEALNFKNVLSRTSFPERESLTNFLNKEVG